ncbi:hypothetical protein C8F01DRAFT_1255017 [Mycena amicta]|nr:hypothetical protein C8F01DRAFT_1255017 [Mycena amicta]
MPSDAESLENTHGTVESCALDSCNSDTYPHTERSEPGAPTYNRAFHRAPHTVTTPSREVVVAVYPHLLSYRDLVPVEIDATAPTLRGSGFESFDPFFEASPIPCSKCEKLSFSHPSRPGVLFTILLDCPHMPSAEHERLSNMSVRKVLPSNIPSCRGTVVVVKHPSSVNGEVINADLDLIDVEKGDLSAIDALLADLVVRLSTHPDGVVYFMSTESAMSVYEICIAPLVFRSYSWSENKGEARMTA